MDFSFLGRGNNAPPQRGFGGRGGGQPRASTPPEVVNVVVTLCQIVKVDIPYMTPRSTTIRAYCASFLLDENNRRLLFFRKETGWTNVSLDATPAQPLLTMEPAKLCREIEAKFANCPDVQKVVFKTEDGMVVTCDQIDNLPFRPLVGTAEVPEEPEVTGTEIHQLVRDAINKVEEESASLHRQIVNSKVKVLEELSITDSKLAYITSALDDITKKLIPFVGTAMTSEAATPKAAGKRKSSADPTTAAGSSSAADSSKVSRTTRVKGLASMMNPIDVDE